MTATGTQMTIAAFFGIALAILVVRLSRRGQLSFRYTMGWIGVASIGILGGLLVPLTEPVAGVLGLSAAALLALVALILFVVIAIQLSISISGLQQHIRTLSEELARLRHTTSSHDE